MPSLVRTLHRAGISSELWIALRETNTIPPFREVLARDHSPAVVYDEGVPGRALRVLANRPSGAPVPTDFFAVGPVPFMEKAVSVAASLGVAPGRIRLSLEQPMLCGVGLCGGCHHRGLLTCHQGTFVTAAEWRPEHDGHSIGGIE
jgi:dihydroorotate dehydrogenase (NAD+) catalytic subunit